MFEALTAAVFAKIAPIFSIDALARNEIFIGLFMTGLLGTLLFSSKYLAMFLYTALVRYFTCDVYVSQYAAEYQYLKIWLNTSGKIGDKKNLSVMPNFAAIDDDDHISKNKKGQRIRTHYTLGHGTHFMFHNGTLIRITTEFKDDSKTAIDKQKMTIRFFTRNRNVVNNFFEEIINSVNDSSKTEVHYWVGYWKSMGQRSCSRNSYVSENDACGSLKKDVEKFLVNKQWYLDKGIPYKRGYLLYGPPGTGKTSLVAIIANELGFPIYIMNLSGVDSDSDLTTAFSTVPPESIILIEDIDSFDIVKKRKADDDNAEPLPVDQRAAPLISTTTMSALLNVLDGIVSKEGRIIFMTTNHIEKIDSAIIRPGRADVCLEILPLTRPLVRKYISNFYSSDCPELPETFKEITGSKLQEICLRSNDAIEAIDKITKEHNNATV